MYQTISLGKSALVVESNIEANVYIDGKESGKTPLEVEIESGEIEIRVVSIKPLPYFYTAKLRLNDNIKTIVRHKFGESEGDSSTQIITFEKSSNASSAEVVVISDPVESEVFVDDQFKGLTPLATVLPLGIYEIAVKKQGYVEETTKVNSVEGNKLVFSVDLAYKKEPPVEVVEQVKILSTPTGFLRVRAEPGTSSAEVGQVLPEQTYELLEQSQEGDWYRIKLPSEDSGWVSGQYAQIVSDGE